MRVLINLLVIPILVVLREMWMMVCSHWTVVFSLPVLMVDRDLGVSGLLRRRCILGLLLLVLEILSIIVVVSASLVLSP